MIHVKHYYKIVILGALLSGCGGASNAPKCAGDVVNTWKLSGGDTIAIDSSCAFTEVACAQRGVVSELTSNTLKLQIESQGAPISSSCSGPGTLSCTYIASGITLAFSCTRLI